MSNERDKAARSLHTFGNALVSIGKGLRRIKPRDLGDENLRVVEVAIDELRSLIEGIATELGVTKIN